MDTEIVEHPASSRRRITEVGVLAWLRLARIFQKIDRHTNNEFRCRNITAAQFDVLAHVGAAHGPNQQELADSLLVTKGNICQLLDRMESSGLLERRQEGRTNRLFLTEKGKHLYQQVVPEHEHEVAELFSPLSEEEQMELLRLLRKLDRALI